MKALSLVALPLVALVLGAFVGLGWQAAGSSAGAPIAPAESAAPPAAAQAPSQLQAVLHGPRHRVQQLRPAALGKGETSPAAALTFPALVSADTLVEHAQASRRVHLRARVTRSDRGFTFALQAVDDQVFTDEVIKDWQPGLSPDSALDRLVASVARSLMALESELAGGQRHAWTTEPAATDDDAESAGSTTAPIAPDHAPTLLLTQQPPEGRYRVLSTDDLDEIQLHANGSLRWLRSSAAHDGVPTVHSALVVHPQAASDLGEPPQ